MGKVESISTPKNAKFSSENATFLGVSTSFPKSPLFRWRIATKSLAPLGLKNRHFGAKSPQLETLIGVKTHDVEAADGGGLVERRLELLAGATDVGAAVQQHLGHPHLVVGAGQVQGCQQLLVRRLQIPFLQQLQRPKLDFKES